MKAIDYHLYSRNGRLYYRYALPKLLQFLHKEIKISLSTKEIAVARLYVAQLDIEIQNLLNQIYAKLREGADVQDFFLEGLEGIKFKIGLSQRQSINQALLSPQASKQRLFSQLAKDYLDDCVSNSSF